MQCIFCKACSDTSISVEHIIPESLGNTRAVLPKGVVCDRCNNYFARKIEQPLLDEPFFKDLRGRQRVENKRRRVPPTGLFVADPADRFWEPGELLTPSVRADKKDLAILSVGAQAVAKIFHNPDSLLLVPRLEELKNVTIMSRFLAKIALELMADRVRHYDNWESFIIDNAEFDPLRNWARRGEGSCWPFHQRRIYPEDKLFRSAAAEESQVVWEWTPLIAYQEGERAEVYSVLCIFGIEFAINYAGRDIVRYTDWLTAHGGASPLYDPTVVQGVSADGGSL